MTDRTQARVLVVDDEPANVRLLTTLLAKAGFGNVRSTTDARQVMDMTEAFEPDLILLDLHMPHFDGFELLERLSTRINGPIPVPVLVLTADITDAARDRALRLGAKDFVSKPYRLAELVMRIGNLVDSRLTELELAREVSRMRSHIDAIPKEDDLQDELRAKSHRIETALEQRDFYVAQQPIVSVTTGALVGYESLARFPTPPITPPDVWFRTAHEVGLGIRLELATLELALADLRTLPDPLFVSINVTEATLRSPALTHALAQCDHSRVVLELTESDAGRDFGGLAEAVASARALGLRIAADDTGSGFASFQHLLAVRPDLIKLDRAIVTGINGDAARRALTVAVLTFATEIGSTVVAEGVETAEEYAALGDLGIQYAQGYFIGRPEPLSPVPVGLDHLPRPPAMAYGGLS